jgi:hypothetical protein
MAARLLLMSCVLAIGLTALGCAQRSMVATLPPPNFSGPMIAQAPPRPPAPQPKPAVAISTGSASSPREWTPRVKPRDWQWIVVHHSATPSGDAAHFDRMHKDKGWDELGYHFVIGNGTDSGDGQIEVGPRWPIQKHGAHAKTPDQRYNNYGIGICLVGNFDLDRPTAKQMQSLARLTAYLMKTYSIRPDHVLGHRDTGRATDCPGEHMDMAQLKRMVQQALAASDGRSSLAAAGQ